MVCNQASQSLWVSFGFESEGDLHGFGWLQLDPSSCDSSLEMHLRQEGTELSDLDFLWLHARDRLNAPTQQWGQTRELCVDEVFERFSVRFADSTCEKRGYARAYFNALDVIELLELGRFDINI